MALLLSGACAVSLLSVNSASTGGNSATYLIGEGKGAQRNTFPASSWAAR